MTKTAAQAAAAKVTRSQFIQFTRTDGTYDSGIVVYNREFDVYNRGGVIRYRAAQGQGPRWVKHTNIAEITVS